MVGQKTSDRRWVGFDAGSKDVLVVQFCVPTKGPVVVEYDLTWDLQTGDRPAAYSVLFDRVRGYLQERAIEMVAIKASAVSGMAATAGLLAGAEVRGVVAAAARSAAKNVLLANKGAVSRRSSRGRVDLYTQDDAYWEKEVTGKMRKGSRELAYLVLKLARPDEVTEA